MRSRLWIVFLILLVLLVPKVAIAEEMNVSNELETMEMTKREMLGAAPVTPLSVIRTFFTQVKLSFGSTYALSNIHMHLIAFLTNNRIQAMFLIPAVILVFAWWGVRKAIRMLFRAFRKGKINA